MLLSKTLKVSMGMVCQGHYSFYPCAIGTFQKCPYSTNTSLTAMETFRESRCIGTVFERSILDDTKMQPLIHIGYHKTGTTWLQNFLFKNKEAGFATPFLKGDKTPTSLLPLLVYPNALDFNVTDIKQVLYPTLEETASAGLIPVITAERLSGDPHSGGYDSKEIANRLASVFPAAKVLIVIREQRSMIFSVYQQYIRAGGRAPLKHYLFPTARGRSRIPLFNFDFFKYHRLISLYRTLFGEGNLLVLPYEMFRDAPRDFVAKIIRFAGATVPKNLPYDFKENEAPLSPFGSAIKRHLNFLSGIDTLNPHTWFRSPSIDHRILHLAETADRMVPQAVKKSLQKRMRNRITEAAGSQYIESNRITAELIGCDLKKYGYE